MSYQRMNLLFCCSSVAFLAIISGCVRDEPVVRPTQSSQFQPRDSQIDLPPPQSSAEAASRMTYGLGSAATNCMNGDQASCEKVTGTSNKMNRLPGGIGGDQTRLNIQRSNNEQSWKDQYWQARENERYSRQRGDLSQADYWKQRAEEYKPPYDRR